MDSRWASANVKFLELKYFTISRLKFDMGLLVQFWLNLAWIFGLRNKYFDCNFSSCVRVYALRAFVNKINKSYIIDWYFTLYCVKYYYNPSTIQLKDKICPWKFSPIFDIDLFPNMRCQSNDYCIHRTRHLSILCMKSIFELSMLEITRIV